MKRNILLIIILALFSCLILITSCTALPATGGQPQDRKTDTVLEKTEKKIIPEEKYYKEAKEYESYAQKEEDVFTPSGEEPIEQQIDTEEETDSTTPFSFTVCGDNRPADDFLPQPDTYLKILDLIKKENTDFHITVGDIINGGSADTDITIRQFSDYLEATDILPVTNFVVPGNHDLTNEATRKYFPEMIFKNTLRSALENGIEICLPETEDIAALLEDGCPIETLYYYFEYNNIYFIILNAYETGYWGAIRSDQLEWLEDLLADLKDEAVFVFVHPPPYSFLNPSTESSKHLAFSDIENQNHIREIFEQNRVDAVFSGHEHLYHKEIRSVTHYVITALSGEYPYFPDEEGGFYHYVRIDIEKEGWLYTVIDIEGKIRYQEEISFN
jgi:3',5'-cyclic AMP phosphodiesterase CpdA